MLAAVILALAAAVPSSDEALARAYAPIIWPANNEPTWPMLPFPFAFDAIDNDCDGLYDLEDPTEVLTEEAYPRIEEFAALLLDAEEARRRHRPDPARPGSAPPVSPDCGGQFRAYGPPPPDMYPTYRTGPPAAYFGPQARVLYVGPVDRDTIEGWNEGRAAVPATWNAAIGRQTTLIQYWLYYPFDVGPNPHRHDGEHVAVFVEHDALGAARVKAVVGAGHEANSVNNALIAAPLDTLPPATIILPRRLPDHMPILVELGKHASAPDVNCNGRFDLGADANIYSESVWGSRDVWAGTAGKTLKVGRFESWFSFPRTRTHRYLPEGWWEEHRKFLDACDDLILLEELPEAPSRAARYPPAPAPPAEAETPPEPQSAIVAQQKDARLAELERASEDGLEAVARRVARTYTLFPVRQLYELHALLRAPACADDERCREALEAFFAEAGRQRAFWADRARPDYRVLVATDAARRMKTWAARDPPHVARRDVWKHEAFREPQTDFRPWLFKRLGVGASSKVEGGNLVSGPVVRVADLLTKDSRAEFYLHLDRHADGSWGRVYDAGVDFFSSRTRFFGVYFGAGYNADFATRVFASAGLNFYLPNLPLLDRRARDLSFALYSGINGEVFREAEGADRRAEALRFQVGLRALWGFWAPRHPLAR